MTVYSYSVVRDIEGGGSVGVCIGTAGTLFYGRPLTKFLNRMDAEGFMAMAKGKLSTYEGQGDWRIIAQEVE